MSQIRLVADSSCDLLSLDGVDFVSVPLTLRTETEEFRDDARLDVDAMVATLRVTKGRSYSACPNVADWEKAFGESGDVLAFTITSSLSGSYSAACVAKQGCEERDPSRRIRVVDTLSAGPETMLLLEKAASAQRGGASFDEVCRVVEELRRRTHLLFSLESMHNLAQNGRISKLAATAAGVLGIRAVGQASAEGTLEMLGKCRGVLRLDDKQGRQRAHRALRDRRVFAGAVYGAPPPLSQCRCAAVSAQGPVQLLCRARRHHDGLRDMKKEGKGRAAELLHLTVRILTLPPIVIGVTLAMLYVRSAERGSAARRWSTESGERGCRLCTEGAPAPFEPN